MPRWPPAPAPVPDSRGRPLSTGETRWKCSGFADGNRAVSWIFCRKLPPGEPVRAERFSVRLFFRISDFTFRIDETISCRSGIPSVAQTVRRFPTIALHLKTDVSRVFLSPVVCNCLAWFFFFYVMFFLRFIHTDDTSFPVRGDDDGPFKIQFGMHRIREHHTRATRANVIIFGRRNG